MKRLGIFLGFTPRQLVPHEGISRLIGFIVKGATSSEDIQVTIAGPSWLRGEIATLLEDAGVPAGAVRIITTTNEPYIVRLWRWWDFFKKRPEKPKVRGVRLKRAAKSVLAVGARWLSTSSPFVLLGGAVALLVLTAVLSVPALIAVAGAAFIFSIRQFTRHALRWKRTRIAARQYVAFRKKLSRSIGMVDRVREAELGRLIRKLNKREDIDVWYVPSMFWPEVAQLKGKVVMAAPDIVFYEHPSQYIGEDFAGTLARVTSSLPLADHLITYSDYVKKHHLVERQGIPASKISVIRHGVIDTSEIERGNGSRGAALHVLHAYLDQKRNVLPKYLDGFRFDDVPFLFYSSQVRPHKNIEGLIAVYEKLLREHYRPVKLVLTGKISTSGRITEFLRDRGLQRDVLSLPSVPNTVLAALYRLATLSVTPTMFEGGFPFTFAEAYSVGTPSIMSRIPAVTEIIKDQALLERMTFNPRNRDEMLQKIIWGLDNRESLFEAQSGLFETISKRTWSTVAEEYLSLMRRVAEE